MTDDGEKSYSWDVRRSSGEPCGHCGEPVMPGFLIFRSHIAVHRDADGTATRCIAWLCLRCTTGIVKRWTKDDQEPDRETPDDLWMSLGTLRSRERRSHE